MLLLAIDTAGPNCAVALARGRPDRFDILARREERIGRGHAELLMPMIEAMLAEASLAFSDLDRIAVTAGPGSFTGVRVGIAAARGLALALNIPAVGVGSLAALALPFRHSEAKGTIVAAFDAKRGEVYAFAQDLVSGAVISEAAGVNPPEFRDLVGDASRPLILTGSGAPLLAAGLGEGEIAGIADAPDIANIAALGLREETKGPPVPLYGRGADAKPQSDKAVLRK